ncbi:hypothetical protein C0J52_23019 [Blattella germanica]|nr:hypothetical protein C0J52_23019 [Blattella germanica]
MTKFDPATNMQAFCDWQLMNVAVEGSRSGIPQLPIASKRHERLTYYLPLVSTYPCSVVIHHNQGNLEAGTGSTQFLVGTRAKGKDLHPMCKTNYYEKILLLSPHQSPASTLACDNDLSRQTVTNAFLILIFKDH